MNGSEGNTFVVSLPVPILSPYVVEVTNQGVADNSMVSDVPEVGKTTTAFTINTSVFVSGGDIFGIYVNTKTAPDNVPAPRVDSYNPGTGSPGDVIQVFGQFFTGTTAVDVNGTNVPIFTVNTDSQITLTLPAGFTTGPVHVTTPSGTGTGPDFTRASWVTSGTMNDARETFAFGVLNDGRPIAAGGAPDGSGSGPYFSSVEIFDPSTGVWTAVASMSAPRGRPLGIVLPSGKFLVAGGYDNANVALTSSEIYDPVGNTWAPTGALVSAQVAEGGTLFIIPAGPNAGNVLCAFNSDGAGTFYNQSEIYNVGAGTWGQTATTGARFDGTTVLLASGSVLGVGCRAASAPFGNEIHTTLWDPATNTWTNKADMLSATRGPGTVQLDAGPATGQVLVAGGLDATLNQSLATVMLYDPIGNSWAAGPAMAQPRSEFALGYMSDGRIIAAGGDWVGVQIQSLVQFFDQTIVDWVTGPSLTEGQITGLSFGGNQPIFVDGLYVLYGGASTSSGIDATGLTQVYVGPP